MKRELVGVSLFVWVSVSCRAVLGAPESLASPAGRNRGLAAAWGSYLVIVGNQSYKASGSRVRKEKDLHKIIWLLLLLLLWHDPDSYLFSWDCEIQVYLFSLVFLVSQCWVWQMLFTWISIYYLLLFQVNVSSPPIKLLRGDCFLLSTLTWSGGPHETQGWLTVPPGSPADGGLSQGLNPHLCLHSFSNLPQENLLKVQG